jgi:hypothetical protein
VVHKPHVVRSLTRRLSKASPGVYSTYRINVTSYFTLMHVMYCALRVGSYLMMVIGCMVVPFHILSLM